MPENILQASIFMSLVYKPCKFLIFFHRITKLIEGKDYYFRVFAENKSGMGIPCEISKPIRARQPICIYNDKLNCLYFQSFFFVYSGTRSSK